MIRVSLAGKVMGLANVLIVSDNFLIRLGLRNLLEGKSGIRIAGEAGNTSDAIACMKKYPANVVILAIHKLGSASVDAITEITKSAQKTKILVITSLDDPLILRRIILAGAHRHLLESHLTSERLIKTIYTLASGKPCIASHRMPTLRDRVGEYSKKYQLTPLTPREKEVLDLIFEGQQNSEIAGALNIVEKTVKNHINSIYTKLHIRGRSQAIRLKLAELELQSERRS